MYLVSISNHGCVFIEGSVKHNQNRVRTSHVVSINIKIKLRVLILIMTGTYNKYMSQQSRSQI